MHIYFHIFCFGPFYVSLKNPVHHSLLPIFSKPQMLSPNMAWRSFGLKPTSGGCGQNMKSHLSGLQTKQTVFGILKNILEYFLAIQLCSTEPEKGLLNCSSGIHQNGLLFSKRSAGVTLKGCKGSPFVQTIEPYYKCLYLWLKTHIWFSKPLQCLVSNYFLIHPRLPHSQR